MSILSSTWHLFNASWYAKFKESNLIEKARNLRNFLFGFIAFLCIYFLTGKFSKELGIKTSCNSFQQQHHPEKCEVEKE